MTEIQGLILGALILSVILGVVIGYLIAWRFPILPATEVPTSTTGVVHIDTNPVGEDDPTSDDETGGVVHLTDEREDNVRFSE